jgi:hypothetical protein
MLAAATKQRDGQISKNLSSPARKNISLVASGKSVVFLRPSHPTRGAARDRHETRGGMRWTRKLRLTSAAEADGEGVWFWRPDAGAKLAGSIPPMTVTRKPGHRGERVISRKTIAQGMPDCLR